MRIPCATMDAGCRNTWPRMPSMRRGRGRVVSRYQIKWIAHGRPSAPRTRIARSMSTFGFRTSHSSTRVLRTLATVVLAAAASLIADAADAAVVISEFVANNSTGLQDEDGALSDWIEIWNSGASPVDLGGWRITDTAANPAKWLFPATVVGAGQYLVIFASSKNRAVSGAELHTNFALSSGGEYLGLSQPNGTIVSEYAPSYPPQIANVSYGLTNDLLSARCFLAPTPGAANAESPSCSLVDPNTGLYITEFMASNSNGLQDQDGAFSDWIEIFNSNGAPVDLGGWYLTDSASTLTNWAFPTTVLAAGARIIVFASNKNRAVSGAQLHTNFALSGGGEYLALVKPNSQVAYEYAPTYPPQTADISWGLSADLSTQRCFVDPTPGTANNESLPCGFVAPLSVVPERGFYNTPVQVTLSTTTSGAQIRYTTDGTEPTATNGTIYTAPIAVSTTSVIRAAAFHTGLQPTPSVTHTYLYLDDVLGQPAVIPGYPNGTYDLGGGAIAIHDNEMDPNVVDDPAYSSMMIDALTGIPTMSIATSVATMFGGGGFYDGGAEAPASVEI
ncbi:MAG: hypothetical protein E4H00_05140, partial [Myxococcales bacterium]